MAVTGRSCLFCFLSVCAVAISADKQSAHASPKRASAWPSRKETAMSLKKSHGVRWLIFGAFTLLCLLTILATPGVRRAVAGGKTAAGAQPQTLSVANGGSWSGLVPTTDVPVHISL